jgi:hypothetical protein
MVDKLRRFSEDLSRIEPGPLSDGELFPEMIGSFPSEETSGLVKKRVDIPVTFCAMAAPLRGRFGIRLFY